MDFFGKTGGAQVNAASPAAHGDPVLSGPRTRVVDLGAMPREQIIEVAKKQASQIREKNIRISAMEELIESFTSGDTGTQSDALRRYLSTYDPKGKAPPDGAAPGSPHASATTAALEQSFEEERLAYLQQIDGLELRLRELEDQLDASKKKCTAIEAKMEEWKAKTMAVMTQDQQRIQSLELQLAQRETPPPNVATAAMAVPPEVLDAALREKVAAWRRTVEETTEHDKACIRHLEHQVAQLQLQLASQQPATATTHTDSPHHPDLHTPKEEPDSLPLSSADSTTADLISLTPIDKQQLNDWKKKVRSIIEANATTIQDLTEQIRQLQQQLAQAQAHNDQLQLSCKPIPGAINTHFAHNAPTSTDSALLDPLTMTSQQQNPSQHPQHRLADSEREREESVAAARDTAAVAHDGVVQALRDEVADVQPKRMGMEDRDAAATEHSNVDCSSEAGVVRADGRWQSIVSELECHARQLREERDAARDWRVKEFFRLCSVVEELRAEVDGFDAERAHLLGVIDGHEEFRRSVLSMLGVGSE